MTIIIDGAALSIKRSVFFLGEPLGQSYDYGVVMIDSV